MPIKMLHGTLDAAIALAATAHAGQVDKQGAPYILHPLRVMMDLREDGFPEIYQIVGVLHDAIEDTDITIDEIRKNFGDRVAGALVLLTHGKGVPYLEYVQAITVDPIATEVKKRDLRDNTDFRRFFPGVDYTKYAKAMAILLRAPAKD